MESGVGTAEKRPPFWDRLLGRKPAPEKATPLSREERFREQSKHIFRVTLEKAAVPRLELSTFRRKQEYRGALQKRGRVIDRLMGYYEEGQEGMQDILKKLVSNSDFMEMALKETASDVYSLLDRMRQFSQEAARRQTLAPDMKIVFHQAQSGRGEIKTSGRTGVKYQETLSGANEQYPQPREVTRIWRDLALSSPTFQDGDNRRVYLLGGRPGVICWVEERVGGQDFQRWNADGGAEEIVKIPIASSQGIVMTAKFDFSYVQGNNPGKINQGDFSLGTSVSFSREHFQAYRP